MCQQRRNLGRLELSPEKLCANNFGLGGRFGYFLFFSARGGGGGSARPPGGGGGVDFLLKIPEGGGFS